MSDVASRFEMLIKELHELKNAYAVHDVSLKNVFDSPELVKLRQEVTQLRSENKALKISLNVLREQREQDRKAVALWQLYNERAIQDSTEKVCETSQTKLPSDSDAGSQQLLSSPHTHTQKLLAMSIGLDSETNWNERSPTGFEERPETTQAALLMNESWIPSSQPRSSTQVPLSPQEANPEQPFEGPVGTSEVANELQLSGNYPDLLAADALELNSQCHDLSAREHVSTPAKRSFADLGTSLPTPDTSSRPVKAARNTTVSALLRRDWHPNDFILNSESAMGSRAPIAGLSSKQARTLFGTGRGQNDAKITRANEVWKRQETPKGFWRSDFAGTQEEQEEQRALAQQRHEEALHRLSEAIVSGKYAFRDKSLREAAEQGAIIDDR